MNFKWKAVYEDGSELSQYNEDGSENKYPDIERSKLVRFALLQFHSAQPCVILHLNKNQRLIYRRRVALRFGLKDVNIKQKETIHLIGYQELINGRNVQTICFVFEDGHIEIIDGFKKKTQWFYPVEFMPEEQL